MPNTADQSNTSDSTATPKLAAETGELNKKTDGSHIAKTTRTNLFPPDENPDENGEEGTGHGTKLHPDNVRLEHSEGTHPEADTHRGGAKSAVSPIRTYEGDTKERVEETQATTAQMAVVQQEADRDAGVTRDRPEDHPIRRSVSIIAIVLLTLGALTVSGYALWYTQLREAPGAAHTPELTNLFLVDRAIAVATDGQSPRETQEQIAEVRQNITPAPNSGTRIYLAEEGSSGLQLVDWPAFLRLTGTQLPARLSRAVTARMYGIISPSAGAARNQPFLVLQVNSYEGAFASLLRWETSMVQDLTPLFGSTLLSQSAITTPSPNPVPTQFVDRIIANRHVRLLPDSDDTIRLIWSFADRQTVIITTSRASWREILDRLQRAQFSQ